MSIPCIACIGVIGKHDNPLHIALFPPYIPADAAKPSVTTPVARTELEFSFLLNASLDQFDVRARDRSQLSQDLGLLQHIDERLSIWGWLTGTGTKFAVIVDTWGKNGVSLQRSGTDGSSKRGVIKAPTDADLKVAFKALQAAYIRLLQNPFYVPDDHSPMAVKQGKVKGGEITSQRFIAEVRKIGERWRPGLSAI